MKKVIFAFLISMGMLFMGLQPADSSVTPGGVCGIGHCYERAIFSTTNGVTGAQTGVQTNCWSLSTYVDEYGFTHHLAMSNEMWIAPSSSNISTWVEVGQFIGETAHMNVSTPHWYWADKRPNGIYDEHLGPAAALRNIAYPQITSTVTSGVWSTTIYNADLTTLWTNNFATGMFTSPVHWVAGGMETLDDQSHAFGALKGLQWRSTGGVWSNGFGWSSGSAGNAVLQNTNSSLGSVWWISTYTWLEDEFHEPPSNHC